jgi:hypothetical protein
MQNIIPGIIGLVLFIVCLPYSLVLLLSIVFLILVLSPSSSNRTNRKVERWSRGRKRYY